MRVAHVEPGERTAPEVAQHRSSCQRVVRDAMHRAKCRCARSRVSVDGGKRRRTDARPARAGPAIGIGRHQPRRGACVDISIRYIVAHMLELAVLGLLADQPRHGYDLRKRLSETLGPPWGISFGSLYPALRRLERAGAIEEVPETDTAPRSVGISTGSLT